MEYQTFRTVRRQRAKNTIAWWKTIFRLPAAQPAEKDAGPRETTPVWIPTVIIAALAGGMFAFIQATGLW